MLRLQYLHSTFKTAEGIIKSQENDKKLDESLRLPASDLASLNSLCLRKSLEECFNDLVSASSHKMVVERLQHVSLLWHTSRCIERRGRGITSSPPLENVGTLWMNVAERYFK